MLSHQIHNKKKIPVNPNFANRIQLPDPTQSNLYQRHDQRAENQMKENEIFQEQHNQLKNTLKQTLKRLKDSHQQQERIRKELLYWKKEAYEREVKVLHYQGRVKDAYSRMKMELEKVQERKKQQGMVYEEKIKSLEALVKEVRDQNNYLKSRLDIVSPTKAMNKSFEKERNRNYTKLDNLVVNSEKRSSNALLEKKESLNSPLDENHVSNRTPIHRPLRKVPLITKLNASKDPSSYESDDRKRSDTKSSINGKSSIFDTQKATISVTLSESDIISSSSIDSLPNDEDSFFLETNHTKYGTQMIDFIDDLFVEDDPSLILKSRIFK